MMTTIDDVRVVDSTSAATLGDILRRAVYAQLPSRFYGALQLSVPLAAQFWTWGWRRTAGWLVVGSAFGIWALAQQKIVGYAEAGDVDLVAAGTPDLLWRVARSVGGAVGSLTALALLLEGFAQVMAAVYKCPGCSG
jgi:hypothetical protein